MTQSETSPCKRLHALINGRVQGVGFRATTQQRALKLKLAGWVRNRQDGKVEVVAEGPPSDLDAFLKFLNEGPRTAHVTQVTVEWSSALGEATPFAVKPTL